MTLGETDGSGTTIPFARVSGTSGEVRYVPSSQLPSSRRVILALISRGATQVSARSVTALDLKQIAAG